MRKPIALSVRILAAMFLISMAAAQAGSPPARLTILVPKKEYSLGERVIVTYRITNLSESLLCFPPPAIDCNSISGQLAVSAAPPPGVNIPRVGGGCAACRRLDRDAAYDIDQHWIKLGPQQSYEVTQSANHIGLIARGKWTLEAGYVPVREDTESLYDSAMKTRACGKLPELHSAKVTIMANEGSGN
jgi:hypothetical protein